MAAEAFALLADPQIAQLYARSAAQIVEIFNSSAWHVMAESAAGSFAIAAGDERQALRHFDTARGPYERAGQPYWAQRSLLLGSATPA